jgi:hypothetical protein
MKRMVWISGIAMLVLVLAACAPSVDDPTPGATSDPAQETPVIGIPGTGETLTPSEPAEAARWELAQGLGITMDEIQVVNQEEVEWPNACLGMELPDVPCAEVLVPGQRVTLEVEGRQYVYHTGSSAERPVLAGIADDQSGDNLILIWNRTGGIAGFCDQLRVFQGGLVQSLNCEGGVAQPGLIRMLDPLEQDQLRTWTEQYSDITIERTDPATADAMTIRLDIQGTGEGQPDEREQERMLEFVQILQTHLFPPMP